MSYRSHFVVTLSLSVRKWLVQQHTPFSGVRTSTLSGVSSNTDPPLLSHTVRQQEVVRFMSRSSFSASATVPHSSSTRRKLSKSGTPAQLNWDLSLLRLMLISLMVTDSPASFIPLMTPAIGLTVTAANARFPSPLYTTTSVCSVMPSVGVQSKLRANSGPPVVLRSFSTTTVEHPNPLVRSATVLANSRSPSVRPAAFAAASSSAAWCGGKFGFSRRAISSMSRYRSACPASLRNRSCSPVRSGALATASLPNCSPISAGLPFRTSTGTLSTYRSSPDPWAAAGNRFGSSARAKDANARRATTTADRFINFSRQKS